ncbi:MAG: response regulator [Pseudomonadota bacterium]
MIRYYLIEDNALIRFHLVEALEEVTDSTLVGYASGEKEAKLWLTDHPESWDVLICDLWLSDGSGLGVIEHVRPSEGQRIVVLSNHVTPFIRERCKERRVAAVFDKSQEVDNFFTYFGALR